MFATMPSSPREFLGYFSYCENDHPARLGCRVSLSWMPDQISFGIA